MTVSDSLTVQRFAERMDVTSKTFHRRSPGRTALARWTLPLFSLSCALTPGRFNSTCLADDVATSVATPASATGPTSGTADDARQQRWNFHFQTTAIVQGDPAFSAKYSGPNSLKNQGEVRDTESVDLYGGLRLWNGAEAHVDALAFRGFGLTKTLGVENYPSAEAYKVGTYSLDFTFARLFLRQTIGFGGEQENVSDDQLTLGGKQDVSRLTFTVGRFGVTDLFDTNTYANNARTQFMSWGLTNNLAFDYAADSIGFTTGFSAELNQPHWTLRYGFFQLPATANSFTAEDRYLLFPKYDGESDGEFWKSWQMPLEFERRYKLDDHPGTLRLLGWVSLAHMGSYAEAASVPGADITQTRAYRFKYGFGLNWEQEIARNIGVFSRLGWNDGHEEAWAFTDVNYEASLGTSVKGEAWHRPDDIFALAGVFGGISSENKRFLEAGGTGILDGDGALNYGWEKSLEAYYDFKLSKLADFSLDYQFVDDPAFNRDRGPVSIFGARLHVQL